MRDCIFCRIIAGEEPASIFYEDDIVIGIMTISPVTQGHAMIIPKKHAPYLKDMDEETGSHLFRITKRTAEAIRLSNIKCDGINLFLADGEAAFQEIFHVHMHVFPRFKGDSFRLEADWDKTPSREDLDKTALYIKEAYGSLWK